jgi:hypothetical protein
LSKEATIKLLDEIKRCFCSSSLQRLTIKRFKESFDIPAPSLAFIFCNHDAELNISSTESSFTSLLPELTTTRDITIPTDFVMPIIDPENRVGLPSPDSHNIFSNLCLADFDINSSAFCQQSHLTPQQN